MRPLLLAALLLLASGAEAGTPLWQGAEHGMSPEQVVRAVPGATLVDEPTIAAGLAGTEIWFRAQVEHYELAGHDFRVAFLFGDRGLQRILMQLNEAVSSLDATGIEMSINDALLNRYGSPFETRSFYIGGNSSFSSYKSGPVTVRLARIDKYQSSPLIELDYSVKDAIESDKL